MCPAGREISLQIRLALPSPFAMMCLRVSELPRLLRAMDAAPSSPSLDCRTDATKVVTTMLQCLLLKSDSKSQAGRHHATSSAPASHAAAARIPGVGRAHLLVPGV